MFNSLKSSRSFRSSWPSSAIRQARFSHTKVCKVAATSKLVSAGSLEVCRPWRTRGLCERQRIIGKISYCFRDKVAQTWFFSSVSVFPRGETSQCFGFYPVVMFQWVWQWLRGRCSPYRTCLCVSEGEAAVSRP